MRLVKLWDEFYLVQLSIRQGKAEHERPGK
jgi:hypothetical protein